MYTNTAAYSSQPIKAWRLPNDPDAIWFGHPGLPGTSLFSGESISLSLAEAQQLIAELQRELAAVEAEARGATA